MRARNNLDEDQPTPPISQEELISQQNQTLNSSELQNTRTQRVTSNHSLE